MIILRKLKQNMFFVMIFLAYAGMMLLKPSMGMASVKNSAYYIREMLIIMPVIFVLTALLDLWVPKEKIMHLLGKEAKGKGIFFSFVIGSISAGPIYAAFPMCVMLRKKGATIRNIIIILSSWAVIKVPMLLNEAKFLGSKFMVTRWLLTVMAIIIFSWVADRIIADEDLPKEKPLQTGITVNSKACMGCGLCVKNYPQLFEMDGKKATVKAHDAAQTNKEKLLAIMEACPVKAIEYAG
ncbi:MAG: permease [Firmicutes bacterium]|nr:permease [Bacillota bacterium]